MSKYSNLLSGFSYKKEKRLSVDSVSSSSNSSPTSSPPSFTSFLTGKSSSTPLSTSPPSSTSSMTGKTSSTSSSTSESSSMIGKSSSMTGKSSFTSSSTSESTSNEKNKADNTDFDAEGRILLAKASMEATIAANRSSPSFWNPCDPIYRHSTGGGIIYVGNQSVAENYRYLKERNITHIVNCTYGFSKIPNFHEDKVRYYEFPISHWQSFLKAGGTGTGSSTNLNSVVLTFIAPLFRFIEDAIRNGGNVLIHCLAGAHRAGTTGCACLIFFNNMDVSSSIIAAKKLRPIIDPIGQLPEFLKKMRSALDSISFVYDAENSPYISI